MKREMSEQVAHVESHFVKKPFHLPSASVGVMSAGENPSKDENTPGRLMEEEIQRKQLMESIQRMNMIAHFETLNTLKDVGKDLTAQQDIDGIANDAHSVGEALKAALFGDDPQPSGNGMIHLGASTSIQNMFMERNSNTAAEEQILDGSPTLGFDSGDDAHLSYLPNPGLDNGISHPMDLSIVEHDNNYSQFLALSTEKVDTNDQEFVDGGIREEDLVEAVQQALEAENTIETRPLPVFVKWTEVDLFKLCMQVRAFGGYDKATAKGKWAFISKSVGLGQHCGALLKLVYVKYLRVLENWMHVASHGQQLFVEENAEDIPDRKRKQPPSFQDFLVMLSWMKHMAVNPCDTKKGIGSRGLRKMEDVKRYEALVRNCRAAFWNASEISGSLTRQKRRKALHGHDSNSKNSR